MNKGKERFRTRIHNHLTPSERVFCRPAALKNLAIHKVLSAFFRLAGQQNPSPIRHPLIMNTGSRVLGRLTENRRKKRNESDETDFGVPAGSFDAGICVGLRRQLERSGQLRQSQSENEALKLQLSHERTVSRFFAYYGRVAAAGTSVEFSDIAAGVRAYPENEINKQADYVIGVNGDSMEPEYFDGDIVYVQKTDHIEIGDIGIFQRGNSIYIKKVGENGLISLNPDYPPLMADGDRIMVLGKVLGKAEEI